MTKFQLFQNQLTEHFRQFELGLNGEKTSPVHLARKEALDKLQTLVFPTTKDEEWKYTDITSLVDQSFDALPVSAALNIEQIEHVLFPELNAYRLVFVDGVFEPQLSSYDGLGSAAELLPLEDAYKQYPELILEKCASAGNTATQFFSALNTSFLKTGVFFRVHKNAVIEKPVYILYLNSGRKVIANPRNIFIAETGSQCTIIENYTSLQTTSYLNNAVTGVFVGENAKIEHLKIQDESLSAYHVSYTEVFEARYANYTSYNINFGGKITRNNIDTHFDDENSETHLYGLYIAGSEQLIDNHTLIDHAKPNCQSNELYKGVMSGNGRGVFNGKVLVRQDAQKTNAFQENKNILLTPEALVDTKPQLEIFADDVKCTHGATIGQLDESSLFYLRSRGFSKELAKNILIFAFADDVVKKIPFESIVTYLEKKINQKLDSDF